MGNDREFEKMMKEYLNFNPRSLVGNDVSKINYEEGTIISIHVPSWGTTVKGTDYDLEFNISIHVPSWGTTILERLCSYVA